VGFAGTPHESYYLYQYCLSMGSVGDFTEMLKDANPLVRIIGAKCILNRSDAVGEKKGLNAFLEDETVVIVGPGGCTMSPMKVREVVQELIKDPKYLGR
jgi:hypothetical protein